MALAVALLLLAHSAVAQANTGMISGTIVDDQGQVLPGATVTLIDELTSQPRTLVSDSRGDFRWLGLRPGTYTLRSSTWTPSAK